MQTNREQQDDEGEQLCNAGRREKTRERLLDQMGAGCAVDAAVGSATGPQGLGDVGTAPDVSQLPELLWEDEKATLTTI